MADLLWLMAAVHSEDKNIIADLFSILSNLGTGGPSLICKVQ
jgi:hypothetical protein